MKFLCLAYGDAKDWNALTKSEQDKLSEQDEAIRQTGALMGAVQTKVVSVTAWDGKPRSTDGAFAHSNAQWNTKTYQQAVQRRSIASYLS